MSKFFKKYRLKTFTNDNDKNFKIIFNSAPVGMLIVGKDLIINEANKSAQELLGGSINIFDKKIGEGLKCINSYSNENGCGFGEVCKNCTLRKYLNNVYQTDTLQHGIESNFKILDQGKEKKVWYRLNIDSIVINGEKKLIVSVDDVTEKKENEKNLEIAKEAAEAGKRSKSEFLTNMSHEIRTPLNGIIGMINLTKLSDLNEEQNENLNIAKKCAYSLLSMINGILDFSKMESGKMIINNDEFDINKLMEEIIMSNASEAEEKGIYLAYNLNNVINERLIGDSYKLRQILNNLINNAIKFTASGKVIITVKRVSLEDKCVKLNFSIEDTGIGINEKDIERLFRVFSQLDASDTRKYGGTGIGLAISKQLVEIMGGHICVKSKKGKGSIFSFSISFKKSENKVIHSELEDSSCKASRKLNILLAEDKNVSQLFTIKTLNRIGHDVKVANNVGEVVDIIGKENFDLVLMDVEMSEMQGVKATAILRNKEKEMNKHIPIIALTANTLNVDREKYLSLGMDNCISKSFHIKELYKCIENTYLKFNSGYSSEKIENEPIYIVSNYMKKLKTILEENHGSSKIPLKNVEKFAHIIKEEAIKINTPWMKTRAFKLELAARRESVLEISEIYSSLKNEFNDYMEKEGDKNENINS
jgi:signal transduction histidine kinase/CheY-like chemotaxis protein